MLEQAALQQALDQKLTELIGQAAERVTAPVFEQLFRVINDPHESFRSEAVHSPGDMKEFAQGESIGEEQPFEGGLVTITPVPVGTARRWSKSIVAQLLAEGHSLLQAVENWMKAYTTSRDRRASALIKGSATGYDGAALFSASHPSRSKSQAGDNLSNLATTAALSADSVSALLDVHEDTMAYGENGEPIDNPADFIVASRRTDFTQLKTIQTSTQKAGVSDNDANVDRNWSPLLWRKLQPASGSTYYIYGVTKGQGLLYVERSAFGVETEYESLARSFVASAAYEGGFGWNDWRSVSRMQLA